MNIKIFFLIIVQCGLFSFSQTIDNYSDTWVATDELGRALPCDLNPNSNKTVGMFYFIWHNEESYIPIFDTSKALLGIQPWGGAPEFHHYKESIFGYYSSQDEFVIRKQMQMLSDAGVDFIFLDCTNAVTYQPATTKLLNTLLEMKAEGRKVPKVSWFFYGGHVRDAFLSVYTNFLTNPNYAELFFIWENKPLLLTTFIDWQFESNGNNLGWGLLQNNTFQTFSSGKMILNILGSDPYTVSPTIQIEGNSHRYVRVKMKNNTPGTTGEIYFTTNVSPDFSETKKITFPIVPNDPEFREYVIDMHTNANWVGSMITRIRIDPVSNATTGFSEIDYVKISSIENEAIDNSFTLKKSWAWTNQPWFNESNGKNRWSWLDNYPQNPGLNSNGSIEQISVSAAQHPYGIYAIGKSTGADITQPPLFGNDGKYFQLQWNRALLVDPPLVMITQWNEWIAQRFIKGDPNWDIPGIDYMARQPVSTGGSIFVDSYTPEYSRDLEPLRTDYRDNMYLQLVNNIRLYKGTRNIERSSNQVSINMTNFSQWVDISSKYIDDYNDVIHRNHASYGSDLIYTNFTGRNDIVQCKVTYDNENAYFYVKTKYNLSSHTNSNWMNLLIDIDKSRSTGWEGYDVIVNQPTGTSTINLKYWDSGNWISTYSLQYFYSQNEMHIKIPLNYLAINPDSQFEFDFKWVDNVFLTNDILDVYVNGDTAPNGRFNYRFKAATCNTPYAISVSSVTHTSAQISWIPPVPIPSNGYEYFISTSSIIPTTQGTLTMSFNVNYSGLQPGTTYYVFVRSNCGGNNYSSWTTAHSFTTLSCSPIITYPYVQDFMLYVPNCWFEATGGHVTTTYSTIANGNWIADGFLNNGSLGAAKINLYQENLVNWLISPEFTIPLSAFQLRYDVGTTQLDNTNAPTIPWESDDFVYLVISQAPYTSWTILKTYSSTNVPSSLGQNEYINIGPYSGQTVRFAFVSVEGVNNGLANIDFFVDNFTLFIDNNLSLDDIVNEERILVYPNPTSNIINIKAQTPIVNVQIFSLNGKLIFNGIIENDVLDISSLQCGQFNICLLHENGKISTVKIIKE